MKQPKKTKSLKDLMNEELGITLKEEVLETSSDTLKVYDVSMNLIEATIIEPLNHPRLDMLDVDLLLVKINNRYFLIENTTKMQISLGKNHLDGYPSKDKAIEAFEIMIAKPNFSDILKLI